MRFGGAAGIFALAIAVRLLYLAAVYRDDVSLFMADSPVYLDLARSALAWLTSGEGHWMPDPARMPLYPLFLAAHAVVYGSADPLYPVITQLVIDSLACTAIAALAGTFAPRLYAAAGIVAALNPTQIVFASLVLTDSLFFAFVCAMLLGCARWLHRPDWSWAAITGLAGGLALLTRAVIWPFLAAMPVLLVALSAWRHRLRPPVGQAVLASVIAVAAAAPILEQNVRVYGAFRISSQNGDQALFWLVPLVREASDGTRWQATVDELRVRLDARRPDLDTLDPFAASAAKMDLATEELRRLGLGAIVRAWAVGGAINLLSPAAILSPPVATLPRTGFYATPGDSKLDKVWNFLARNDNPLYGRILVASTIGAVLTIALAFAGAAIAIHRYRAGRPALTFLVSWAAYVLMISGPVASAKYRLPFEPVIVVFVAIALKACLDAARSRRRPPHRARMSDHAS